MPRDEMGKDQNRNRKKSSSSRQGKGSSSSNVDPEGAGGGDETAATAGARTAMLPPHKSSNHSHHKKRGRHESTDTDASEISATLERAPPDGGWGWVVVGAAFLVNMIADGVTFSFGVFYVEFNKYFGESKSKTAWIGSLLASMPLLSGPIASSLADRFGCRRVTIAGSLLATIGFVLSSYANSVEMLCLTFGVLTGFGLSLCYVAAVVIVAYYFEQRRSLATGLSVCGGGIGTFIFAPLTAELINAYGWRGTTLLLAGAFLNLCVCGALMRDLEWTKKKVHRSHAPEAGLEPAETNTWKKERMCNSALCIPTFVQEQEHQSFLQRTQFRASANFPSLYNAKNVASPSVSFPKSDNNSTTTMNPPPTPATVSSVTNGDIFGTVSNICSGGSSPPPVKTNNNNFNNNLEVNPPHPSVVTSSRGDSSTANTNVVPGSTLNNDGLPTMEAALDTNPLASTSGSGTNLTTAIMISNFATSMPSHHQNVMPSSFANNSSAWSGIHRHSLTYRGAVLSLKRYRLRPASSCPDIISVATADDRINHVKAFHEWKAVLADVCKWIQGVWEWEHLSNSRFILFILSNLLLYMWYDVPYMYLQDAALQSHYSDDKSSYLVSVVGIFNMFGNILLGYMGDKEWANAAVVYGVCMALCGGSMLLIPCFMAWNYTSLALGCGVFGLTIAANYSLTSVILVEVVSIERFANAYGLLLLVQGIGNLVGPPIAGVIYDMTGTFSLSFMVAGGGVLASSVFILAPKCFNRRY